MPSGSLEAAALNLTSNGASPVNVEAVNEATGDWFVCSITTISVVDSAVAPSSSVTVSIA